MPTFYERFRAEVNKYADGVHRLGPAARPEQVKGLPDDLASFLRSWNGAELFIDAYTIFEASRVAREGELTVFGQTSTGDRLALDAKGRVLRIEEDTGEILVEGTSFARWIEAVVAADGVLYDREGEFRDDVFDETGEEMRPELVEKRERKALKIDPRAPAPAWRLAKALEKTGRPRKALDLLMTVVEADPAFGWAWFDLGRMLRASGKLEQAEEAFSRAAEADPDYDHAGYFAAHAARAAADREDEPTRAQRAARALELDPDVARSQKEAARRLLSEGDSLSAALEAAEIAAALQPRDLELLDLLRKLRER